MNKKKTVTLCASSDHYKQLLEVAALLKKQGLRVIVPIGAYTMQRTNNFDAEKRKTWNTNPNDYKKKARLIRDHFNKIKKSDVILVTNYEKKGFKGYIGGNVLMEMGLAFALKKKIYILNPPDDRLPIKEEIYGVLPLCLNGQLAKINH